MQHLAFPRQDESQTASMEGYAVQNPAAFMPTQPQAVQTQSQNVNLHSLQQNQQQPQQPTQQQPPPPTQHEGYNALEPNQIRQLILMAKQTGVKLPENFDPNTVPKEQLQKLVDYIRLQVSKQRQQIPQQAPPSLPPVQMPPFQQPGVNQSMGQVQQGQMSQMAAGTGQMGPFGQGTGGMVGMGSVAGMSQPNLLAQFPHLSQMTPAQLQHFQQSLSQGFAQQMGMTGQYMQQQQQQQQ